MTRFHVDTEQLQAAVLQARSACDRMEADAAGMSAGLLHLQSVWGGGASAQCQQLVQQWTVLERQVMEFKRSLTGTLALAASSYDGAEQEVRRLFVG